MITTTILGSMVVLMSLISSSNPVKLSFTLVTLSMILFIQVLSSSSSVWMSSIFFMIFIGGIMIMFMVLSSLLPNEKNKKTKKMIFLGLFFSIVTPTMSVSASQVESSYNQESKIIFLSNQSYETLMLVILLYFLSFVCIISKQTYSLRSFLC